MRLIISKAAERDLAAIGDWIATDNPARAASYTRELRDECAKLLIFPRRFPLIEGTVDTHKRTYGNYLILYRVGRSVVTVLGITHAARQHGRLR